MLRLPAVCTARIKSFDNVEYVVTLVNALMCYTVASEPDAYAFAHIVDFVAAVDGKRRGYTYSERGDPLHIVWVQQDGCVHVGCQTFSPTAMDAMLKTLSVERYTERSKP
jgi:hypothetical protein